LPRPPIPAATSSDNPLDAFLADWWSRHHLRRPPRCDDATFLRRVHLDLVGLLPDETMVARFLADPAPDKRARLVDSLLDDRLAYAEHWMTFWNDLLCNDEQGYILVARQPITQWLFQALYENKPYDRLAAELLDPPPGGPEGFVKGIDWEFSGSATEIPAMQVARTAAQAFLGVNLKCASCHSHFTRPWKLQDAWAFASFFSAENLQPHRCDRAVGERVAPRFLFPDLGEVPPGADRAARQRAVAVMTTRPSNPRFACVIVNRLFKKLLGQGLVNRVDDLDGSPGFHPQLLRWLAWDFMTHDHDLKHLLRRITTSEVYQLGTPDESSADPGSAPDPNGEPLFVGPRLRRLTGEQFLDALGCLTGHWPAAPVMKATIPTTKVRAWRHRDPGRLVVALGRPIRAVVVSERPEEATMLQALELVNGAELAQYLAAGAEQLLQSPLGREPDVRKVMDILCSRAFGRPARPEEVHLGTRLLGTPSEDRAERQPGPVAAASRAAAAGVGLGSADLPDRAERQAGWEDLLWILVMTPEFQFIP
jgi:hypothetical protein